MIIRISYFNIIINKFLILIILIGIPVITIENKVLSPRDLCPSSKTIIYFSHLF